MKRRSAALAVSVLAAGALTAVPQAAVAKSCRSGYTHAVVNGAEKCLHGGEFCAKNARATYRRYGYVCQANGRLRQS